MLSATDLDSSELNRSGLSVFELSVFELAVFVYGTLKPGGRYHARYCQSALSEAIPAMAKGQLYDFPQWGYPAMTTGEGWVQGYLLVFRGEESVCDRVLQNLDELEGVSEEGVATSDVERDTAKSEAMQNQTDNYYRQRQLVYTPGHEPLQRAWVYLMTPAQVRAWGGQAVLDGNWPVK